MFYKIGKKIFEIVRNSLHFVQIALIFFCFFMVTYWVFELAQAKWIQFATPFFEVVKSITHLFYNRITDINGVTVDFSFLIATFALLLIVLILKSIIEQIENLEQKYDIMHEKIKKKQEDTFNTTLNKQYIESEAKNNKFLVLVQFDLTNIGRNAAYDKNLEQTTEKKANAVMSDFIESATEEFRCPQTLTNENLLLYFNDFKKVDEIIEKLKQIINGIKRKYIEEKWQIDANLSIDAYAQAGEIKPKVQKLVKINKLALGNKIACLSTFKHRYSLLENKKFNIEVEGLYKLTEAEEEVSVIKN